MSAGCHYYCGELISLQGLEPVAKSLETCSWKVELRQSGYDGTLYLRTPLGVEAVDLEMASGQSSEYLFSGSVDGDISTVSSLLGELSALLTGAGFVHRLEIYSEGGDEMLLYLHFGWPLSK